MLLSYTLNNTIKHCIATSMQLNVLPAQHCVFYSYCFTAASETQTKHPNTPNKAHHYTRTRHFPQPTCTLHFSSTSHVYFSSTSHTSCHLPGPHWGSVRVCTAQTSRKCPSLHPARGQVRWHVGKWGNVCSESVSGWVVLSGKTRI